MKITHFHENGAFRCPQKSLIIACDTDLRGPGRAPGSKKPGNYHSLLKTTKIGENHTFLHLNHQIS